MWPSTWRWRNSHVLKRRAAPGTLTALLVFVTIVLALGGLAIAAPAGAAPMAAPAAQVAPTTTPTATPSPTGAPAPAPQSVAVPGGSGATSGSLVLGIESPKPADKLHTDRDFLIVGYALDKSAAPNQGAQGSGIDRVEMWLDIPPNAKQLADAELGFSDASAATFGTQFANSGFRLTFHPGDFPPGSHNLYIVAHSAVSGAQAATVLWTN